MVCITSSICFCRVATCETFLELLMFDITTLASGVLAPVQKLGREVLNRQWVSTFSTHLGRCGASTKCWRAICFWMFGCAGFLVLRFPTLLFCFLLFLLLCLSTSLLLLLLCFSAFSCLLSLLLCFSAFVLLCLSTTTFLRHLFFSHVFLLLYFLLL